MGLIRHFVTLHLFSLTDGMRVFWFSVAVMNPQQVMFRWQKRWQLALNINTVASWLFINPQVAAVCINNVGVFDLIKKCLMYFHFMKLSPSSSPLQVWFCVPYLNITFVLFTDEKLYPKWNWTQNLQYCIRAWLLLPQIYLCNNTPGGSKSLLSAYNIKAANRWLTWRQILQCVMGWSV